MRSTRARSTRKAREATHAPVDITRTLTVRSQRRKEKHRELATNRMVEQAKSAQCEATGRRVARAAARHMSVVPEGPLSPCSTTL